MIVKMNGAVLQDAFQPILTIPSKGVLLNAVPSIPVANLPEIGQKFIDTGQEILVWAGMSMAVISGIVMIAGLNKEGWKRLSSILQGLGVGLIGPTAVMLVAGFCLGIANLLK